MRISEIRARILNEESNLCTNLTNQLDCIKTEIQIHHHLIIILLVFKKQIYQDYIEVFNLHCVC